jgi:hypothetical protein
MTWHRETDEFERVDDPQAAIDTVEGIPAIPSQPPPVQRMAWQDEVDDGGATEPLDREAIRAAIEATSQPPPVQRMAWQDEVDDGGATEPLDREAIRAAIEATSQPPPSPISPPAVQRGTETTPDTVKNAPAGGVQRTEMPEDADRVEEQPIDLFEALLRAGMISDAAPNPENTSHDLLDFLQHAPPPPDVSGQDVIHRSPMNDQTHYESPADQVMRAETNSPPASESSSSESESVGGDDVDIDKLAREVYSRLRNRLRIERERRDQ